MANSKLTEFRKKLDEIDRELIALIARRLQVVNSVDSFKKEHNLPGYDPARWAEASRARAEIAKKIGVHPELITQLFEYIHEFELENMYRMPHAYFIGPKGSFSHKAAQLAVETSRFLLKPVTTWSKLWQIVEEDTKSLAVLPVENSITSSVYANMDVLFEGKFSVQSEVFVNIKLGLFAKEGVSLEDLKTVYSHPQALAQASRKIEALGATTHETESTSAALELVQFENDASIAALAPAESTGAGLACLAESFQDSENNQTRFLVISAKRPEPDQKGTKASLLITLVNKVGSLETLLADFKAANFDMTRIESRPVPSTPWSYRFWIDILLPNEMSVKMLEKQLVSETIEEACILGVYTPGKVH